MKSIYLALVLIGLLLAGCTTPTEQTPVNETNTTPDDTENVTVTPPAEEDCGTDMDCFISNAEDCSKSKMDYTVAMEFFGTVINTTSFMQINGTVNEKCIFQIRTERINVHYDKNTTQQLLDSGKTMEEIKESELNLTLNAASSGNKIDEVCKFDSSEDLASMLKEWQAGNFSTSDYENAECMGLADSEE